MSEAPVPPMPVAAIVFVVPATTVTESAEIAVPAKTHEFMHAEAIKSSKVPYDSSPFARNVFVLLPSLPGATERSPTACWLCRLLRLCSSPDARRSLVFVNAVPEGTPNEVSVTYEGCHLEPLALAINTSNSISSIIHISNPIDANRDYRIASCPIKKPFYHAARRNGYGLIIVYKVRARLETVHDSLRFCRHWDVTNVSRLTDINLQKPSMPYSCTSSAPIHIRLWSRNPQNAIPESIVGRGNFVSAIHVPLILKPRFVYRNCSPWSGARCP
jgi:hypothetical protein